STSPFGAANNFLAFVEKELIPFVEDHYRASGVRTISGNSAGGLFVLYTLLSSPALFHARFCYSTPFWRFDSLMVKKVKAFLISNKITGFLYMSVGENETPGIKSGFDLIMKVLKQHAGKSFVWRGDHIPHADHQDNARIATSKALTEWGKYLLLSHQFNT